MPQYLLTYHGGSKPASKEEGEQHMARYHAWLGDLGSAAIVPMQPVLNMKVISVNGVSEDASAHAMMGYTIFEADDMDAALEIAKACPTLEMDTAELAVAELMDMQPS